jgi:hypothetical protein
VQQQHQNATGGIEIFISFVCKYELIEDYFFAIDHRRFFKAAVKKCVCKRFFIIN